MVKAVALIVFAYILGSIPTGVLVARIVGAPDPRTRGSGNIGATNVTRTVGRAAGVITLVGDVAKGAVPTALALYYMQESHLVVSLTGLMAFLGHLYPIFLGFRGGKGVATACGVMALLAPLATLISAVVFLVVAVVSRYVSMGSITAAALLPISLGFFPAYRPYLLLAVIVAVLVIFKHRDNMKRILKGEENKI